MANVNISNCTAHPKKCPVPAGAGSVSFHAGDAAYTLFFRNSATFGMSSTTIPQGGQPTSLPIQSPVSTGYCITGPGCPSSPPCPPLPGGADDDGDPYEITIGSVHGSKPKAPAKRSVKTTVKRAANLKAKATGKSKPKPKKKAAAKTKGKTKTKPAGKARKKR